MMFGNLTDEMRKIIATDCSTSLDFALLEKEFSTKGEQMNFYQTVFLIKVEEAL